MFHWCNHGQWCHLWSQCILGTLLGSGPSSSRRCLESRQGQREDAGNGIFWRDCWRLWVGWIPVQEWSTSIHGRCPTWWSSESVQTHGQLPTQWASCGDCSRWPHWGHGDLNTDVAHHWLSGHRWMRTPSPWAHLHGWSLPGIPSCQGVPWPLDARQWGISWGHVSWDEHHDIVRLCTHQEIYQFLWTDLETPSSSHQWIWWAWMMQGLQWTWLLLLWKQVQGLEVLCQVGSLWWHNSSSQLLAFCMMEDWGWQDQESLQHTSKSLPCEAKHQGHLATKWWGHGVHHIWVYGICCMQLAWCWHDPGQWAGHLGWSSLGWCLNTWRGNLLHPASVLTLMQSEAILLLLALAGSCTIIYASLHYGAWMSPTTISPGLVPPAVPQSTALMNSSLHGGVSSVLICTTTTFFPLPQHQWWGVFSAPSD